MSQRKRKLTENQTVQVANSRLSQKQTQRQIEILKLQNQVRKVKKCIDMHSEVKKNRDQFEKIFEEVENYQKQIKYKKKQHIEEHLTILEKKKRLREEANHLGDLKLLQLKKKQMQKNHKTKQMALLLEKEYDFMYNKKLSLRRQKMNQNKMNQIKTHSRQYAQRKKRVKTELDYDQKYKLNKDSEKSETLSVRQIREEYHSRSIGTQKKKQKYQQLKKIANQYGNRVQRELGHIKIPKSLIEKSRGKHREQQIGIHNVIEKYKISKNFVKPKLLTNIRQSPQKYKKMQILRIKTENSPPIIRMKKLSNIVDGYSEKYNNGKTEAFDHIVDANLARAELLLSIT